MQFSGKIDQIVGCLSLRCWRIIWEILDPPLATDVNSLYVNKLLSSKCYIGKNSDTNTLLEIVRNTSSQKLSSQQLTTIEKKQTWLFGDWRMKNLWVQLKENCRNQIKIRERSITEENKTAWGIWVIRGEIRGVFQCFPSGSLSPPAE